MKKARDHGYSGSFQSYWPGLHVRVEGRPKNRPRLIISGLERDILGREKGIAELKSERSLPTVLVALEGH